jgi:hypothetical protein
MIIRTHPSRVEFTFHFHANLFPSMISVRPFGRARFRLPRCERRGGQSLSHFTAGNACTRNIVLAFGTPRAIVMPNFKITYMFDGHPNTGWSEIMYLAGLDYTAARTKAEQLAISRMKLSGAGTSLVNVRISDDAITGDAVVTGPIAAETFKKTELADVAWTSAQVRMDSGSLYRRTLMVRGLPDFVWDGNPAAGELQDEWQKEFNKYAAKVQQLSFSIKAKAKGNDEPTLAIKTITQNATGTGYIVQTFNNHTYAAGGKVWIYNLKEAPQLAGERVVAFVPAPDKFEIYTLPAAPFIYLQKATVRGVRYAYPLISEVKYIRIAKRSTGRPFGLFRGRAR